MTPCRLTDAARLTRTAAGRRPPSPPNSAGCCGRRSWSISRFVESRSGASAMICHVCGGDAVGQCKGCARFYCAAHGDLYCIHCTSRVQSSGTMPLSTSGPQCYECRNPADRACAKCGRFFCDQHGGMGISRGSWSTPMCNQCTSYEGKWVACIWGLAALILIGGLILLSFARR